MDTFTLAAICLRRWYVVLPITIMAVAAGFVFAAEPTTSYYTKGNFTLQRQVTPEDEPGLTQSLLTLTMDGDMNTADAQEQVAAAGGTASYTVRRYRDTPVLSFDVTGSDRAGVEETVPKVLAVADKRIRGIQTRGNVPATEQYGVFQLGAVDVPTKLVSSSRRFTIVVSALGFAGACVLALFIDTLARRRRARRASVPAAAPSSGRPGQSRRKGRSTTSEGPAEAGTPESFAAAPPAVGPLVFDGGGPGVGAEPPTDFPASREDDEDRPPVGATSSPHQ